MSMPYPSSGPAPRGLPTGVRIAVALLATIVALGLLRVLLTFVLFDQLVETATAAARDSGVGAYIEGYDEIVQAQVAAAGNRVRILALVVGVGFGVLVAAAAYGVRAGRRWGQVVGIVAAALTALGGITLVAQPYPAWYVVLTLATTAAAIAAIASLLLADTRAHVGRSGQVAGPGYPQHPGHPQQGGYPSQHHGGYQPH